MNVRTDVQFLLSSLIEVFSRSMSLVSNYEIGIDRSNTIKFKIPVAYVNKERKSVQGMYILVEYVTSNNEYTLDIFKEYMGTRAMQSSHKFTTYGKSVGDIKLDIYKTMKMYGDIQGLKLREEVRVMEIPMQFKFIQYLIYTLEQEYINNFTVKSLTGYINIYVDNSLLLGRVNLKNLTGSELNEYELLKKLNGEELYIDYIGTGRSTIVRSTVINSIEGLRTYLGYLMYNKEVQYELNTLNGLLLQPVVANKVIADYRYKSVDNGKFNIVLANLLGYESVIKIEGTIGQRVDKVYCVKLVGKYLGVDGLYDNIKDMLTPVGYPHKLKHTDIKIEEVTKQQIAQEMLINKVDWLPNEVNTLLSYINRVLLPKII